ncbi:probable disease resistance protein At4g27220 [Cannabis sativa]|uniref:probable disease resistance protein At4g27220 n=1 Tax=Cannabis sativa TaxID=3483 RepID=UPI0029CA33A2|nr:probable disease resistance protein At4g27220 [Cannabis sativa]
MDITGPLVGILDLICTPFATRFHYFYNVEKLEKVLLNDLGILKEREKDIKEEIEWGIMNHRKKLRSEAQFWLKQVESLRIEVSDIDEKRRFIKGCYPNCYSRYKLGRSIVGKIRQVKELQERGAFVNGLFIDLTFPDKGRSLIPTSSSITETIPSKVLHEIWECLVDDNVHKIGIYGMGGVGKTTIMMHLNNLLGEDKIFDFVIWVNASKSFDLKKLQTDVAKGIELDFLDDEDMIRRSALLFEQLQRIKKFVLIIDDLWCKFCLEDVGIPQPSKENGCKIVFITRLMEVCRGMETHKEVKVDVLSKEVAWRLFADKAGIHTINSSEIQTIAKKISEECGCLPLAIITVGRAMRRTDDERVWMNALEELKSSKAEIEGMEEDVFSRLKFSYNHLKNERSRACFLYCALFPEKSKIDVELLVQYWMAEGLIDEVGNRTNEINKGYAIVKELKDACMLEGIGTRWVRMHDLVRDMAIRITSECPVFMIRAGLGLTTFPKNWRDDVERVSLMENNIKVVCDVPKSTCLSTLLLHRNHFLDSIPNSFFLNMPNLKVLNLSGTLIESLPDSLSSLHNLRALLLSSCNLKFLPSLAMLIELRVLDLSNTLIEMLPHDIGTLINLRHLDISYTEDLEIFPAGLIPKLSRLEYLTMFRSNWSWSKDSQETGSGVVFDEIIKSTQLTSLGLTFEDLNSFNSYMRSGHWRELKSYHIGVGLLSSFSPISKEACSVEIQGCNLSSSSGNSIEIPENTQQLALQGCHDITVLSKLSSTSNLAGVNECYVSTCNRLEYVITPDGTYFSNLKSLVLRKLYRLKAICYGVVDANNVLSRLKILHIHNCNSLKTILSTVFSQCLENLEEIEIWNCHSLEEIIEEGELELDINVENSASLSLIRLPRLKKMDLSTLPELRSISTRELACNSLISIDVWDCEKLKNLPFSVDNFPSSLKHIGGTKKWWDELCWEDDHHNPSPKTFLEPFFKEDRLEEAT